MNDLSVDSDGHFHQLFFAKSVVPGDEISDDIFEYGSIGPRLLFSGEQLKFAGEEDYRQLISPAESEPAPGVANMATPPPCDLWHHQRRSQQPPAAE